jgi:hypothetical protein
MATQVVTTTITRERKKKPRRKKIPELKPEDVQEIPSLKKSGKSKSKVS